MLYEVLNQFSRMLNEIFFNFLDIKILNFWLIISLITLIKKMASISQHKDVFISYQWDIKDQVAELCNKLEEDFSIWRDDTDMRHNDQTLNKQLAIAIKKSKIVICFLTQKYFMSKNCNREIQFSSDINKKILVIFVEKLDIEKLDGIGFLISGLVRINCYHNQNDWQVKQLNEIRQSILENLQVNILKI